MLRTKNCIFLHLLVCRKEVTNRNIQLEYVNTNFVQNKYLFTTKWHFQHLTIQIITQTGVSQGILFIQGVLIKTFVISLFTWNHIYIIFKLNHNENLRLQMKFSCVIPCTMFMYIASSAKTKWLFENDGNVTCSYL